MDRTHPLDEYDYKMFNVTYTRINDPNNFSQIGLDDELVFIDNYSNASFEDMEGRIHLINVSNNELNETVNRIADANATGYILIRDNVNNIQGWEFPIPGFAVSEENGSLIKSYIQNESLINVSATIPVASILEQGNLMIYYFNNTCLFEEKKIWLVDSNEFTAPWNPIALNIRSTRPAIAGILWYNSNSDYDPKTHSENVPNFWDPLIFFTLCPGTKKAIANQHDSYSGLRKPWIYINKTIVADDGPHDIGTWVGNPLNEVKAKFWLTWSKNPNVESYNVYCTIPGKDTTKTVIISGGHYDGFWGQMSTDDASGVAIMLGILKYMNDHHITPKYNLVFITFSGEEYIDKGSRGYVLRHWDEIDSSIECILNLDVIAHDIPGSNLYIHSYDRLQPLKKIKINSIVTEIAKCTNYYERNNHKYSLVTAIPWRRSNTVGNNLENTYPGTDAFPFWLQGITAINFGKEPFREIRHQTGTNHTRGDNMTHIDQTDLEVSTDLFWNCSKYFIVDPDCQFNGTVTYTRTDSPNDEDTDLDTVEVTMPIKSILPQDLVRIKVSLIQDGHLLPAITKTQDYIITDITSDYNFNITLPPNSNEGYYKLYLYLYNSTGRINVTLWPLLHDNPNDITNSNSLYLHPRGNQAPTTPTQPIGPTSLQLGELGGWGALTSDPNEDLVGQKWYMHYEIIPNFPQYDTGLYNPESLTPLAMHRYWTIGTHQIGLKAYDQYSTLWHPYESEPSPILDVDVTPWSGISTQQQLHQNDMIHVVQNINQQFNGNQYGGQSVQWAWNHGDQTRCSTQNTTHSYTSPGIYNVTLNVTDSETGLTGTTYIHVRVSVLDADYNMSYFHGAAPNTQISFHNISKAKSGNRIINCTWNFSDGTISYDSNVNHSFALDGDYNVTLTVTDSQDNVDVDYYILHITSNPELPEIPYIQSPGTLPPDSEATILAEVIATDRNLSSVKVNITTPNGTSGNYTMTKLVDNIYIYTFDNISQDGQYNFTVWATDIENNTNSTTDTYFMTVPFICFEPPTPSNNANKNQNWIKVNITVLDPLNTSAFIDWNHSLKGYWSMELFNTTGVYDNSTFDNFGTFEGGMNTTNIKTGKYGKGLEFDGARNYVDLGTDSSLDLGTGDFTFMVWEKSHTSSYSGNAVILTNQPAQEDWKGYGFGVIEGAYLFISQSPEDYVEVKGTIDVTDDTWHHLAYVHHDGYYSLYVDGIYDTDSKLVTTEYNITNAQNTCLAYDGQTPGWCYFAGMLDEPQLYNRALSREEINASYNNGLYQLYHNFTGLTEGTYSYYAHAIDTTGNMSETEVRAVTIDFDPQITTVSASPHTVGFGFNVTISANVTDQGSGVNTVNVNITYPDHTHGNYMMSHTTGNTYQYVFSSTWQTGQYNFTIWATDHSNNSNSSSGHHFHVSATATISIATLKNSYNGNQYINITDPPNPLENYTLVGRGLTWNTYYNASTGENILETYQGPVNYQEDNGTWIPINNSISQLTTNHPAYNYGYRNGNDRGLFGVYFKPNAQNDWPVAFTYNRSDDPTIHVIRSKLVGVGYVDPESNWAYQYLQNAQSSQGQFTDNKATYEGVFTGTDVTWSYGNTELKEEITLSNATKTVLQNHPPSMYGLNNGSSYLVFITKLDYQNLDMYNASGKLTGNVTISNAGVDFKDALGYFKCALPLGEAYELNNESMRQKLTYRIVHLNGNTYLLSGLKVSDLNAMTFPVVIDPTLTVYSTSSDGYIYNSSTNYNTVRTASSGTVSSSGTYITIGQRKQPGIPTSTYYVYRGFVFFNTSALPSNAYLDNATFSLYKKDDYSTTDFDITIQNGQPTYPHNPMQSSDYNKNDYSGNGGALNTSLFTSGYNAIIMNNLNWINKTGTTKLCLRSSRDISGTTPTGSEYINVYSNEFLGMCPPKLVIAYRNQSKIKNTGSTDIKGYLLIQVQFYETGKGTAPRWVVDNDTVNETTPRTINSGSQLALDTIFNGKIRASNLQHGAGTYRVYTAFRDPEGNILKTNSGSELKAWWQFSKT
ncbi:MAG: M28 family peptidase [Thermoplasmata archaeon]|nr:M28 family peptidase [Thermoplasmata archaeon]